VVRVRFAAVAVASLLTGAAVAAVGVVAFVGLVAPLLLRRWTGPGHLRLVPAAALLGAVLLVAVDALGRTLAAPAEVPAGVIMAALGAPFLLVLLRRGAMGATA
jgi:ABC-type Fe3+-siderophore transport system permease subunit